MKIIDNFLQERQVETGNADKKNILYYVSHSPVTYIFIKCLSCFRLYNVREGQPTYLYATSVRNNVGWRIKYILSFLYI